MATKYFFEKKATGGKYLWTDDDSGGGANSNWSSTAAPYTATTKPADTDTVSLPASAVTCTYDEDMSSAVTWPTGVTLTVGAAAKLKAIETASSYLKLQNADCTLNGIIEAGTSVAVPFPAAYTFTIDHMNNAKSIEVSATGHLYLYCAQPTNKYVTLDNQELSGATVLNIEENLTGDTTYWAANAVVCVVDSAMTDVQYCTIASVDAGAKTITILDTGAAPLDALDSNVEDKSLILLVTRNIRLINVAASDYAISYADNTCGSGDHLGCEISNCYRAVVNGTGFEYSGTLNILTTSPTAFTSSGTNTGPTNCTLSGALSAPISGTTAVVNNGRSNTFSGTFAGWTRVASNGYANTQTGKVFGGSMGPYLETNYTLTSTGSITYCSRPGQLMFSPRIFGTVASNTSGWLEGTDYLFANMTVGTNANYDLSTVGSGKAYNTVFGSATELANYNTTARAIFDYFESFDHDGTDNAYMWSCRGGNGTSQTASPPSGYTIFYDHEVESALYPCFRQYLTTVLPGTAIEVSAVIRNTDGIDVSSVGPPDLRPRLEIIDVFADPLHNSTNTALDSDPIAVSNGTNTDWQDVDVIWANTGDSPRQVYVRIICYSHDASTHTIDEAWSVADYQDLIADTNKRVRRLSATSAV